MLRTPVIVLCLASWPLHAAGDELPDAPAVLTGIDVLASEGYAVLDGARVGLVTNHTGLDRRGVSTIRLLDSAENVELVAVFSPEHGLEGKLDVPHIADGRTGRDSAIPVFSLYGNTRKPTRTMLEGIDTLVFDIQDIGTRFYTYISTMGQAMEAAEEHGLRFVVLDRPNPIGGTAVAGPVLDDDKRSFVGYHGIAVRHGMTVAELARLFRTERTPLLDLELVLMRHWRRDRLFDQTGLRWVDPSPNMRSLDAALLYPGVGLLETTNLSVGRGTPTPFEVLGAPWIDGRELAATLDALELPGIRFEAIRFTPESSKFADEQCQGIRFHIEDRRHFEPLGLGFALARVLRRDYGDTWDLAPYLRLLGHGDTYAALKRGASRAAIEAAYADGLEAFEARRRSHLLYR